MAERAKKQRKITEEFRTFQEKWTSLYLFIQVQHKPVCLVCHEAVSVMKEYNIKRHYETKHAEKFDSIQGQLRSDKVVDLKKALQSQQLVLKRHNVESELSVKVSYIISKKIASKSKPFSEGEFIKECMESAAEVLCPAQKHLFSKVSLSGNTVARRIEDVAGDIENTLKICASKFIFFSIAADESTDMTDTAQLSIFIRGIDDDFKITEEMVTLFPMKGTTKGCDIFSAVQSTFNRYNLTFVNLSGVVTDGAPAMIGKNEGLVALIKKEAEKVGNSQLMQYHCIIHQQNLCAKSTGFQDVMSDIVKVVNFIRSRGLNHREFQCLLAEIDNEYGDVVYFTDVRWLSRGNMLKRVFDLREIIQQFMESKGKPVLKFSDPEWLKDFGYLTDISMHLNDLNIRLQGKENLINNLFDYVKSFHKKLQVWESQLQKNDLTNFPSLSASGATISQKYASAIANLREEFNARFVDFKKHEKEMNLFATPFSVPIEEVPGNMQMEMIDLQCNMVLKEKYKNTGLLEFYSKFVEKDKFPEIRLHAMKMISLFGSTYRCEQIFSRMKFVKSKTRTRLSDSHLENCLRIASSELECDIDILVKKKQCQISH